MSAARQRLYMARLNADPHKRAEYLMKQRGKKKEDEKLLRTIQHEKCNEWTVKGHEEMCVGMRCILCHHFTMLVSGPTSCGKTAWVLRLIDNIRKMVEPVPKRIWHYYGEYQHAFNNYASVHFEESLPQLSDEVFDGSEPSMIVIDDQMSDINQVVADIFTKISHHRNISILHLTQNLFDKNKYARTISLNAHYLVLFKNPRDAGQFSILARRIRSVGSLPKKHTETPLKDRLGICLWTCNLSRTNDTDLEQTFFQGRCSMYM